MTLEERNEKLIECGEKTAFLLGTIIGQMSNLLNQIKSTEMDKKQIYSEIYDIWNAAALQINEIYYKNKNE